MEHRGHREGKEIKTLLIASPSPEERQAVKEHMGKGFRYEETGAADEVIPLLTAHPETAGIILDVGDPAFGGMEVLRVINESSRWSRVPVMAMMDGSLDAHVGMRAYRFGAVNLLRMPLDTSTPASEVALHMFKAYLGKIRSAEILNRAAEEALACPDPDDAIRRFFSTIGPAVEAEQVFLYEDNMSGSYVRTYRWQKGVGEYAASSGEGRMLSYDFLRLLHHTITGSGKSIIIRDVKHFGRTAPQIYDTLTRAGIRSLVAGPVMRDGKAVGFAGIANIPGKNRQDKLVLLNLMNTFLAMFLNNRNQVQQLRNTSFIDALTGTSNRNAFRLFSGSVDPSVSLGILFCDLDHLKEMNDTRGHEAGDRLITDAASILLAHRGTGHVFRLGGDEFVVLWCGMERHEFDRRVRHYRDVFRQWDIGISMGCSYREKAGTAFDDILKEADSAMYVEKKQHHAASRLHSGTHDWYPDAMARHDFLFYLQPKVNTQTGRIIRAEALVRWQHGGSLIEPDRFLPGMEETGYIYTLDSWLWEETCRFLRDLMDDHIRPVPVSVNISPKDFYLGRVVENIETLLTSYRIPHELFQVEIREKDYAADPLVQRETARLREAGLSIILDHFDCSFRPMAGVRKSLEAAQELQAHVKVDMQAAPNGEILKNVMDMAWKRGLYVEAEGVEGRDMADSLRRQGLLIGQGFYWYRPTSASSFKELLQAGDQVSYELPKLLDAGVRRLTAGELLTEGIVTEERLSSLLGPLAILEEEEGAVSLMQMNDPFSQLTGLTFEDGCRSNSFMDHLDEKKDFVLKAFHSARDHVERGSTFVLRFLKGDGTTLYLVNKVHFLSSRNGRSLYIDMVQRYVSRKDQWAL